jgi:hypothetical protein
VNEIGASAFDRSDVSGEVREIRREDRRGDLYPRTCHRLTSSEIESEGPT